MVESKTKKILLKLPTFFKKDDNSNNYKFINSLSSEYSVLSNQIDGLKESIQVTTSTSDDLNGLAALFQLNRNPNETDSELRARILAYWESNVGGGTEDSIKNAVSSITGLSADSVVINQLKAFEKLKNIASFETTESWVGGAADTTYWYLGDQARRISATGAVTVNSTLSGTWNLTSEDDLNDSFQFWLYVEDNTKITNINLIFTDESAYTATAPIVDFVDDGQLFKVDKSEFVLSNDNFDWTDITDIKFELISSATVFITVDDLNFGAYDYSMIFTLEIEIDVDTSLDVLELIPDIVDDTKSVGVYYRESVLSSSDGIFLINLSELNGADTLL